jgi:flavorubredoxin
MDLLLLPEEKFQVIEDKEQLSLGDKTLEFISTPWVHWPETFSSYCPEDKILFSCDFFGSHLAASNLFVQDECSVLESAKRYYAEIMMPFRKPIRNNLKKLENYDIQTIAPSHGPVYKNPETIINAYDEWTSEQVKNKVVVAYVSMHGSTKKMTEHLVEKLIEKDIEVKQYNLTVTDIGELAMDTVDAATVVLGVTTTLTQAHPVAGYAVSLLNLLRPKTRYAGLYGSYGWGGKTVKQVTEGLPRLKVEFLEPILVKGFPKEKDLQAIDNLAEQIKQKHIEDSNVN